MKPFAALLGGAFASVGTGLVLGFLPGVPGGWTVATALVTGIFVAIAAWRGTHDVTFPGPGFWDFAVLSVFCLASLRAFLWLIYDRGDEICVLSPNNLGDMALHLNFIRFLAAGVPFWPESPILTGVPLTYPLGVDFFNSLLERAGIDTHRGLVWTGLAGAGLTAWALWRWGGAFGVAAFLFNGGLAGFAILRSGVLEDFQSELIWKNLFLSMFVTQRGLLFALPAGLVLLTVWREQFFRSGKRILPGWLQLLFYAAMPVFNLHAFLFLSVMLLAIFLCRPAARKSLVLFVLSAFVPASVCVLLVTGFFSAASGLRWFPGWIPGDSGWSAWVQNFGLSLPLGILLVVLLFRTKNDEARCFVWTAAVVFGACCLVIFAPWEWDNTKLLMWSWLVMAPYLWTHILRPLQVPARAALCLVLFFSGAVSLLGGLDARHGYSIARRSEVDAWRAAVADLPPETRFAIVPDFNHPLILLGRRVACGYEGHLWSHGLPYQDKLALLRSALEGQTGWTNAAPALGVEWLALRNMDLTSTEPPGELPPRGLGVLYDLRPALKPDSSSPETPQYPPRSVDLSW